MVSETAIVMIMAMVIVTLRHSPTSDLGQDVLHTHRGSSFPGVSAGG